MIRPCQQSKGNVSAENYFALMPSVKCLLLTVDFRDYADHSELTLFARMEAGKPIKIVVDSIEPLFFVSRVVSDVLTRQAKRRTQLDLKSPDNNLVDCLYFPTLHLARDCAATLREKGMPIFESDVHPADRYLMERDVRGAFAAEGEILTVKGMATMHNPKIRGVAAEIVPSILSLDVECNADTGSLYSIACSGAINRVFVVGPVDPDETIVPVENERELLLAFANHVTAQDPDAIIGWNVAGFDLALLHRRANALNLNLAIGRDGLLRVINPGEKKQSVRIPGRVIMDVPSLLRAFQYTFDEYSLQFVASAMLGRGKLIGSSGSDKIAEINRLFAEDKAALARYNLEDALLTREIFDHAGILPNALARARLCGHHLDRSGGSVAAFDYVYLPLFHRKGYVAIDVANVLPPSSSLPGGRVIQPKSGIYENVLVFDFKSLYPTIIMTFCIDPLGRIFPGGDRVQGPLGPSFSRDNSILPGVLRTLLAARSQARQGKNHYLAQAIKILMNSFYGVLGSTSCRFFSQDLSTTITGIGQFIHKLACDHIESTYGYKVIYGDTDSLFVLLGPGKETTADATGRQMADAITKWLANELDIRFNVTSALELEFEQHFRHLLLPSLRGSDIGSKKHYCGSIVSGDSLSLEFTGMESARSDWTDIAKEFQHELCRRLFLKEPVDEYVLDMVRQVKNGKADDRLIYKKHIRKPLDEYTQNVPPHVQAARLRPRQTSVVRYFITTAGPQPIEARSAPLDYGHYIEAQLKPVADSVLEWLGTNFDTITGGQMDLFGGQDKGIRL